MPDFNPPRPRHDVHPPRDWAEAFSALPLETAPADAWERVAAALAAPHPARRGRQPWLLAAAVALLALVAFWRLQPAPDASAPAGTPRVAQVQPAAAGARGDIDAATLDQLYAESARLEALLQVARDPRVASGTAAAVSMDLDARVAAIDAALMRPGLTPAQQTALWRERVQALRVLTGFESTRRWLAAHGERYDGALVRVD